MGDPKRHNWPYVDPTDPDQPRTTGGEDSPRSGRDVLTPGWDNFVHSWRLGVKRMFGGEEKKSPQPSLLNRGGSSEKAPEFLDPATMSDDQKAAYTQHVEVLEQMRRDGVFRGDVTVRMREDGSVNLEGSTESLDKINAHITARSQGESQPQQPRQASPALLARNAEWQRQGQVAANANSLMRQQAQTQAPANTQNAGTLKPGDPGYEEMMRRLQQARGN